MLPEYYRPFVPGHSKTKVKSQNMAKKRKSMVPESYRPFVSGHSKPKRVKTWPRSENQCYLSLIGLSYQVTVSQNESKRGQEAKINATWVLSAFPTRIQWTKRVKTWPRNQNQWYPSLIGLSYQVTVSQNESKRGREAKINGTRVLSAFRTRSQWAKTSQNVAKKPKSMLPESYRPFLPGHSEPKRVKTWPRRENQCYPRLVGLSYHVTVSHNESENRQEAKIMYLKSLIARRHETIITYRDITQLLIYYWETAGNIWSKDMLNVYAKHVFLIAALYVRLPRTFF